MKWNAPGWTRSHDPLLEVAAEAGRVRLRQAHVFVEVEEDRARPVDLGRLHQRVQELELGGAGGGDHVRATADRRWPRGWPPPRARPPPPPSPPWSETPGHPCQSSRAAPRGVASRTTSSTADGIAGGGAMPDAPAERGDVDLGRIREVRDHAVPPLEVVPAEARPGGAAIGRAVRGLVEAGGVEDRGIAWVDGHVVDVLGLRQHVRPRRFRRPC